MIIAREYNPFTGMEITYERDTMVPGRLHIHQRQRCDAVIDRATKIRNGGGPPDLGHGRIAAVIPPALALEVGQKYGINPFRLPGRERLEFLKREIVNNRDYYKLRLTEGNV